MVAKLLEILHNRRNLKINILKIDTIIFDIGGVIFSNDPRSAYEEMGRLISRNPIDIRQQNWQGYLDCIKIYGKENVTNEKIWLLVLEKLEVEYDWKILDKIRLDAYSLNEDVANLIKKLFKASYKLGVLSNIMQERFRYMSQRFDFEKYFSSILLSSDTHVMKPDEKAMLLAIDALDIIYPEQAVFIDDGVENIKMASKLELNTILFENSEQLLVDLGKLGIKY